MHTDPGIALLSALAAAIAMGICAFFWIATAWPEGAGAVAFAAVACTLFASLDDPTPTIRNIATILALCIPIVIVYQFIILPAINGLVLLSAVLGFALIPAGLLLATPAYAPVGLALALGFCVEMNLQTAYTADLATIINSNSAFVLGGVAGLVGDPADACHRHAGQRAAPDAVDLSRSCRSCRRTRASDSRSMGQPDA